MVEVGDRYYTVALIMKHPDSHQVAAQERREMQLKFHYDNVGISNKFQPFFSPFFC
jgi:hypothetical protein